MKISYIFQKVTKEKPDTSRNIMKLSCFPFALRKSRGSLSERNGDLHLLHVTRSDSIQAHSSL